MDINGLPIGKILGMGIIVFALTAANAGAYFAFTNISGSSSGYNNPACIEDQIDSYPVYKGTVKDIEVFDEIGYYVLDTIEPGQPNDEPVYEKADSVELGYTRLVQAKIKIDDRWFYADGSTYVPDSIADSQGNITVTKGSRISVAYGNKPGITDYSYIYAIKPLNSAKSSTVTGYVLVVLIPSIVILVFSAILIFAWNRSKGLRICSIVAIALTLIFAVTLTFGTLTYLKKAKEASRMVRAHAPVIYLYNNNEPVNVMLGIKGSLTCTYPKYDEEKGWNVTASPDGTLTDSKGRNYEYLFWEADLELTPDLSSGFCVKGADTEEFLERSLRELGLNDIEANAFIMYWLPQMETNEYNVITFQTDAYEEAASLDITPVPDTVIRVNMLWYPSSSYKLIEAQDLTSINPSAREGFTVVEWGGENLMD